MKLQINKRIISLICLFLMTNSAFAYHAATIPSTTQSNVYIGFFLGDSRTHDFNIAQYATDFITEASGGPLAVNAFGDSNNRSAWFYGAQIGYLFHDLVFNPQWSLTPAIELEGFYLDKESFKGDLANNTARLPEHDFQVTYPMSRSVFLANFILTLNNPCSMVHPYIGAGIGGAVVRISGADALQVAPPELDINHYNANSSDTTSTFAGQIKAGLSVEVYKCVSLFAEYRWLYLSSTHFDFGSTVYPTHVETSNWRVRLDPQRSDMLAVGVRFNL